VPLAAGREDFYGSDGGCRSVQQPGTATRALYGCPGQASARRGHGEGSVYWDAAHGTWVGAISLGWCPDGTRIRRKVAERTKTDVRQKLKRPRAEADAGLKTSASYTPAKAVEDWAAEA
jgi:hypothetical protein